MRVTSATAPLPEVEVEGVDAGRVGEAGCGCAARGCGVAGFDEGAGADEAGCAASRAGDDGVEGTGGCGDEARTAGGMVCLAFAFAVGVGVCEAAAWGGGRTSSALTLGWIGWTGTRSEGGGGGGTCAAARLGQMAGGHTEVAAGAAAALAVGCSATGSAFRERG